MAGKCVRNTHLETTHDQHTSLANAHETYLKILDDLKNDLEQISSDVIMVQKEYNDQVISHETDDGGLENSLKELETQNDRLEQALKLQTQNEESALTELQTNNEHLQRTVRKQEQHILYITNLLKNVTKKASTDPHQAAIEYVTSQNTFSDDLDKKVETLTQKLELSTKQEQFLHRETRKLNEELNECKRKNADLVAQAHRVGSLLQCQETHRKELVCKYEALEQSYDEQAKKLRTANNQLLMLEQRVLTMEKRQLEHNMERNMLHEEVLSLKDNHACALGRQKSIKDQLINTEKELYLAHDVIKEQKAIMQHNDRVHAETQRRQHETYAELQAKFDELAGKHQNLLEEHEKQKEITAQQLKIMENFRKWKQQQLTAEHTIRDKLKMYQEYLNDMLEDKETLLSNFHDLSKDYSLLQNELDRLKMCPLSVSTLNKRANTSEKSIAERLEMVKRTTRRISEQSVAFKDAKPIADKSSEEPI